MQQTISLSDGFAFGALMSVPLVAALLAFIYRGYVRTGYGKAYLLALLGIIGGVVMAAVILNRTPGAQFRDIVPVPRGVSIGSFLLPLFLVPLVAKLYRAWIGGHMTDAERLPGAEGLRAWFGVGNLICVVGVAVSGWLALGYSFWALLVIGFGVLAACPVMRAVASAEAEELSAAKSGGAGPSERERVLRMLEEGKVQADEAAELLSALGEKPVDGAGPLAGWSRGQKLILIGAILVMVGFVMPWFDVNVSHEVKRAMDQLSVPVPSEAKAMVVSTMSASAVLSGKDIGHGLGWFILAAALGVAGLNLIPNQIVPTTRALLTRICLCIGAALLVYLLIDTLRYVSVGILVVLLGYGMLATGGWPRRVRVGALAEARS
jgi:hypothetical protein